MIENNNLNITAQSKLLGEVLIIEKLNASSSDGQLEKWVAKSNGKIYFFKGCTTSFDNEDLYECESECIAGELAHLFGIGHVVDYKMDELSVAGKKYKVCVSEDFINGHIFTTYDELIRDIAKYNGREKYDMVTGFDISLKSQIDAILLFDAVIGNDDRHLNNLAIINTEKEKYIPLFDNGASMFSRIPQGALKLTNRTSFDYQKCKPFFNTVGEQINLVEQCRLERVSVDEISEVVNRYVEKKRAKSIMTLLCNNLEKVGDHYGRELLY